MESDASDVIHYAFRADQVINDGCDPFSVGVPSGFKRTRLLPSEALGYVRDTLGMWNEN